MLRIHSILMRIRILDPHWIQVISSRFPEFFLTKIILKFFVLFFSLIFILKLDEPFRNEEIFIISLFLSSDLGFMRKKRFFCSFWLIFYPLDPDPWIRIFLQIRIQEAKACGSNGSGSLALLLIRLRFQWYRCHLCT